MGRSADGSQLSKKIGRLRQRRPDKYNSPVIDSGYKGVKIEVDLQWLEDGNWTGKCKLTKPDGTTEELFTDRSFPNRELAKDMALQDARLFIDRGM